MRAVLSVAFAPGGTWLAAGFNGKRIGLMDVRTGRQIRAVTDDEDLHCVPGSFAISPDGSRLAAGYFQGGGSRSDVVPVIVFDTTTAREIENVSSTPMRSVVSRLPLNGQALVQ